LRKADEQGVWKFFKPLRIILKANLFNSVYVEAIGFN